jgi:hypothetical protein
MSFTEETRKKEEERSKNLEDKLAQIRTSKDNHPKVLENLRKYVEKNSKPVVKTFTGKLNGKDVTGKIYPVDDDILYEHEQVNCTTKDFEMAIKIPITVQDIKKVDTRLRRFFKDSPVPLLYKTESGQHTMDMKETSLGYLFGDSKAYRVTDPKKHLMFLKLVEPDSITIYLNKDLYRKEYSGNMKLIDAILKRGLGLNVEKPK